jgi:hypothetical protein
MIARLSVIDELLDNIHRTANRLLNSEQTLAAADHLQDLVQQAKRQLALIREEDEQRFSSVVRQAPRP